MSAAIKSQSLKENGPYLPLTNCILTFRHLEERLSRTELLSELFFFLSLPLSFIQEKNIVINLVDPNTAVQSPFRCGSIVFVEGPVFGRKACQLAVMNFNNSHRNHLVASKCGSSKELVISAILNSVGKTQSTHLLCFNWWTWREQTVPCKPTGHMAE